MRVECERCHALVVADFEVDPDGVTISCGTCGGTFRAEARRRPEAATGAEAAPGCVKCGAPMTDDPACPRCGLARARAEAWAAAERPPAAALVAAWAATEQAWSDATVHDRVAALALSHGELPWLARRYREVQRARPADTVARARIDRVGFMTLAALKATAAVPQATRTRTRVGYIVALIVGLAIAGALIAAKATTHERSGKRRPAVPAGPNLRPRAAGPTTVPVVPSIEPPGPGR